MRKRQKFKKQNLPFNQGGVLEALFQPSFKQTYHTNPWKLTDIHGLSRVAAPPRLGYASLEIRIKVCCFIIF